MSAQDQHSALRRAFARVPLDMGLTRTLAELLNALADDGWELARRDESASSQPVGEAHDSHKTYGNRATPDGSAVDNPTAEGHHDSTAAAFFGTEPRPSSRLVDRGA